MISVATAQVARWKRNPSRLTSESPRCSSSRQRLHRQREITDVKRRMGTFLRGRFDHGIMWWM